MGGKRKTSRRRAEKSSYDSYEHFDTQKEQLQLAGITNLMYLSKVKEDRGEREKEET